MVHAKFDLLMALCACCIGASGLTVTKTPGLGVKPMPENSSGTLIYYKANDNESVFQWTSIIDRFMAPYHKKGSSSGEQPGTDNRVQCSFNLGPIGEKQVCDVHVDEFYPCISANQYGYRKSSPCIFLKLDDIVNWKPQPYNNTENLPESMPNDLKQHISMVSEQPESNVIWVSCEGENPADIEYIGPVQYFPRRGFPSYYYPFFNKEGYLSPLVAVRFERPMIGVLINIECKAWAKNIVHDSYERRGSIHFELMVD